MLDRDLVDDGYLRRVVAEAPPTGTMAEYHALFNAGAALVVSAPEVILAKMTEREVMRLAALAKQEQRRRECDMAGCPRHARDEGPDAACIDGRLADARPE